MGSIFKVGGEIDLTTDNVAETEGTSKRFIRPDQYQLLDSMLNGGLGSIVGPQGPDGPMGPQGEQGEQGQAGPQGPAGLDGAQGPAGAQGEQGEQGPAGATGATGGQGPRGDKGDKGDKGDLGSPGQAGGDGPRGADGARGEKGDKGDPGSTGGAGLKGDKGDKGDQGYKGDKGDRGDQGQPGASIVTRAKMTTGGTAPDVDVVIVVNTAAITISLSSELARKAQTFLLLGSGAVTFQGGPNQTIAGALFTVTPGTVTAPVSLTFVRNPDAETQWYRVNR